MEYNSDPRKKLEFIRPSDFVPIKEDDNEAAVNTNNDNSADGLQAQVYLRLRPIEARQQENYEINENHYITRRTMPKTNEVIEKTFEFTKIFDTETSQRTLFDECVSASISQLPEIDGATFMAYGTSGSGKTHTILGTVKQPGIIPRAIVQLFSQFGQTIIQKPLFKTDFQKRTQVMLSDGDVKYEEEYASIVQEFVGDISETFQLTNDTITSESIFPKVDISQIRYSNVYVSFIEIYNENVYDLLDLDSDRVTLKIMGNDGESYVSGAQWVFAGSPEALFKIVEFGIRKIQYAETGVNARSSRSHTILMIDFISLYNDRSIHHTLYKFCDLAGSERAKKTNAAGSRLNEAKQINKSLMTLGRCLQVIHTNQKGLTKSVVPVRDSKLSFLLQSALLGHQKLVMVVNLMPSTRFYDENLNVLNFSAIAKQIVTTKPEVKRERRSSCFSSLFSLPVRPSSINSDSENDLISKLVDENEQLKLENRQLKEEMLLQEMAIKDELLTSFKESRARLEELFEMKKANAVSLEAKRWELKYETLRRRYERLQEDLEDANEEIEELESKLNTSRKRSANREAVDTVPIEIDEDDDVEEVEVEEQ